MKAYKVFDSEWKCRGFQYEVGKTYEMSEAPELCKRGFHACVHLVKCFDYYSFDPANKVAEVELLGIVVGDETDKVATNKIAIIKELTWGEVLGMVNTGIGCSGKDNSGNRNSGDYNAGNRNSGDYNAGNRNSGHYNSGDYNSGHYNSGNHNSGHYNSGHYNSGDYNSGYYNSGDYNSGDYNSGHYNSGDYNSGHCNSGNHNSGYYNSGHYNSGHCNSTDSDMIRLFNKWIPYQEVDFPNFFYFSTTVWVSHDTATEEEKGTFAKEIETCGGFLKTLEYKEAFKLSYQKASKDDKEKVKLLPNFDKDVFFEISGIMVED